MRSRRSQPPFCAQSSSRRGGTFLGQRCGPLRLPPLATGVMYAPVWHRCLLYNLEVWLAVCKSIRRNVFRMTEVFVALRINVTTARVRSFIDLSRSYGIAGGADLLEYFHLPPNFSGPCMSLIQACLQVTNRHSSSCPKLEISPSKLWNPPRCLPQYKHEPPTPYSWHGYRCVVKNSD